MEIEGDIFNEVGARVLSYLGVWFLFHFSFFFLRMAFFFFHFAVFLSFSFPT
jgi:hypothetical protein